MGAIKVIRLPVGIEMTQPIGFDEETKEICVATWIIKEMLGGKWPDFRGFSFDEVHHYRIEDGFLVPYDFTGEIVPGPDFKLELVPDSV